MFEIDKLSNQLQFITQDLGRIGVEITLGFLFIFLILIDIILNKNQKKTQYLETVTILGFLFVSFLLIKDYTLAVDETIFSNMIVLGKPIVIVKLLIVICSIIVVLFNSIKKNKIIPSEFYSIITASTLGLFVMVMSANWLLLFVAMELVSISSYIMSGFKFDKKGAEAGLKYLIFGAFSSGIMLYGISLIYGLTGSLYFGDNQFVYSISLANSKLLIIALLFAFGGLMFKISAAPFHIWAPDVYEGAPISIVSFLSTAPKIAGVFVILYYWQVINNVPLKINELVSIDWKLIYYLIIAISLLIGNFSALYQNNLKRFIAYSSIAHIGFILMGVAANTSFGAQSAIYYLGFYALMNFAFLWLLEVSEIETFDDLKGKGSKYVFWSILVTVTCISLAGIPPTVGFSVKFMVFTSLFESWNHSGGLMSLNGKLTICVLLFAFFNTILGFFYYMKIPYLMFIKKTDILIPEMNFSLLAKVFAVILVIPLVLMFFISIL